MADQDEQVQDASSSDESSDSDTVQEALRNIPGLAEAVGNRSSGRRSEETDEGESEEAGSSRPKAEDSETVQRALKQLGLQ